MPGSTLLQLQRPSTATIFAQDPAALGAISAFVLSNVVVGINTVGRVSMDMLPQATTRKRYNWTRNPVERAVTDNCIPDPEVVTLRGEISATPLFFFGALGAGANFVRRDLQADDLLRGIGDRREPVFLSLPARSYANMGIDFIESQHDGRLHTRFLMQLSKIRIVSPLAVDAIAAEALATGAAAQSSAGVGSAAAASPAAGLG